MKGFPPSAKPCPVEITADLLVSICQMALPSSKALHGFTRILRIVGVLDNVALAF
jgi:hypothetical protein